MPNSPDLPARQSESVRADIAIVGAGIAGLVAGLTAVETGARVVLIDSGSAGGRARTTERGGYRFNVGPHALYLHGRLQPFLAARGISPTGGLPDSTRVRLLRDGELWPLTLGALDIARTKLLRPRSRLRLLSLFARMPRLDTGRFIGVPWQEFLGNEPDDVAGILQMLVRIGTYVNAPASFDTAAALDQLKLALRGVRYVDSGWQTMVDSLVASFEAKGGTLLTDRTVSSVASDGGVVIETSAGVVQSKAAVIAGLSPEAAARITACEIRGRDQAGSGVRAAVLDLALDRVHEGLVLGVDQPLYLSPHAPVARLAPTGAGLVSVMRYTPDGETGNVETDRSQLAQHAERAGIAADDIVHERYLHRLVVANGFPTARGGGLRGRPSVDALGLAGVYLAGDWVGPHGQLADASSASGEAAGRRAVAFSERRSAVHV